LTGVSTLDLLIIIPTVCSLATIVAVYLLARAMLSSRSLAGIAVLVYGTITRGFNWEIVGGGLTRSPGLLLATLALWQGCLLVTKRSRWHFVATAVLASLTVMCHPEMGFFVAFSLPVLFIARYREPRGLLTAAALGASVVVLTTPWWLERALTLGAAPLVSA